MVSAAPHHATSGGAGHAALLGVGLVIFDFDGVVVDSETISLATLRSALSDAGIEMTAEEVQNRFLGRSISSILEFVKAHAPAGEAAGFATRWEDALFEQFRTDLRVVPQIRALLDLLSAHSIPVCIASSGSIRRIEIALAATQMTDRFSHVFSADFVSHGKPAPDLFLYSAKQLGVAPEDCLVIEDSPSGVIAAKAAGMRCMAFVGGMHLKSIRQEHAAELQALGADYVVERFADVLPRPRIEAGEPD